MKTTVKSLYLLSIVLLTLAFLVCCKPSTHSDINNVGVVSAATPEAALAGRKILNKNGNAVDAAVAVSFVLAVTEPAMSGLGGGTQILLAKPGETPVVINGATLSPASTPLAINKDELIFHRRSTIPSTVKVLHYAWEQYGSGNVTWEELLQPAIHYASNGFRVGKFRHLVYKKYKETLEEGMPETSVVLVNGNHIPEEGDTLKQPLLAVTLTQLAEKGADEFYKGEIARQIAHDMEANEGWISIEDLHNFPSPKEQRPVHTTYRGYNIYSQPPPCGGWSMLLALNLFEQLPLDSLLIDDQTRYRLLIEGLKVAHEDRRLRPVTNFDSYDSIIARKLDKDYARELWTNTSTLSPSQLHSEINGETTHFSIIDPEGTAVAVTASINAYFGAAAASPQLGFLYNSYMDDFDFDDPAQPFAIGPGKMNYSSMSPTIVQKDGRTVLIIGSPGSARIISTVAQCIQQWIDSDLGIVDVVKSPRVHAYGNRIYVESVDRTLPWITTFFPDAEFVKPSGDMMMAGRNAYFGGVHAIALDGSSWTGVADPRRDGAVK